MEYIPGLLIVLVALALYFIPFLTALGNEHRQCTAIFILNLFLGWTLLGWVAALVWACMKPAPVTAM
jgi:Superinfection immunity protein